MTIKEFKDYPDTSTPINSGNLNDNFKEIKSVFNNQIAQGWYKTGINPTFTFVSWDSTTKTGIVKSNVNLTSYLNAGMKVKFTQSGTTKYGIITKITSNQITLFMGTDYTLLNAVITNAFYSMLKTPYGFPLEQTKWTLKSIISIDGAITTPAENVFYNINNASLTIPIGLWKIKYVVNAQINVNNNSGYSQITLSTTTNSITNTEFNSGISGGSYKFLRNIIQVENNLELVTKTTFYLLMRSLIAVCPQIAFVGSEIPTQIIAVCSYL